MFCSKHRIVVNNNIIWRRRSIVKCTGIVGQTNYFPDRLEVWTVIINNNHHYERSRHGRKYTVYMWYVRSELHNTIDYYFLVFFRSTKTKWKTMRWCWQSSMMQILVTLQSCVCKKNLTNLASEINVGCSVATTWRTVKTNIC